MHLPLKEHVPSPPKKHVPSPPLASLNEINHMDTDGNGLNIIKVDKVGNINDSMLDDTVKELEDQNELHLKLSEIKGVIEIKDTSLDRSDYGFASEFPMASRIILLQSGCFIGEKRVNLLLFRGNGSGDNNMCDDLKIQMP
ncbi:hypothetical protein CQW23_12399 [Capsicum baccatum]|uniref:Uncharacterized protein n=1 Tax=Capsicum baccatum TaxID=33114 RepID=A0A2G2WSM7_CAPBA|nr:hypothetical protein CQW23_12399 [Capsicum baccatum]